MNYPGALSQANYPPPQINFTHVPSSTPSHPLATKNNRVLITRLCLGLLITILSILISILFDMSVNWFAGLVSIACIVYQVVFSPIIVLFITSPYKTEILVSDAVLSAVFVVGFGVLVYGVSVYYNNTTVVVLSAVNGVLNAVVFLLVLIVGFAGKSNRRLHQIFVIPEQAEVVV